MHINQTDVEDVTDFYSLDTIKTAGYTQQTSACYQGEFSVTDI